LNNPSKHISNTANLLVIQEMMKQIKEDFKKLKSEMGVDDNKNLEEKNKK
jgi:hypothetical protein